MQPSSPLQLQVIPPPSTVHCAHIDNDKYMGIIKSWNLFLCGYNGGQATSAAHTLTPIARPLASLLHGPPNHASRRPQETHFIWQYGTFYVPEKTGDWADGTTTTTVTSKINSSRREQRPKQAPGSTRKGKGKEGGGGLRCNDGACAVSNALGRNVRSEFSNFANICVVIRRLS